MAALVARDSLALERKPTVQKQHTYEFYPKDTRAAEGEEENYSFISRPIEIDPKSSLVSNTSSKLLDTLSASRSFKSIGSKRSSKWTDNDTVTTTNSVSSDDSFSAAPSLLTRGSTIATCLVATKDIVIEEEYGVEVDIRPITCDIKAQAENSFECVLNPTRSFASPASSRIADFYLVDSGDSTSFETVPTTSRVSTMYSTDYDCDASSEEDSVDESLRWRPRSRISSKASTIYSTDYDSSPDEDSVEDESLRSRLRSRTFSRVSTMYSTDYDCDASSEKDYSIEDESLRLRQRSRTLSGVSTMYSTDYDRDASHEEESVEDETRRWRPRSSPLSRVTSTYSSDYNASSDEYSLETDTVGYRQDS